MEKRTRRIMIFLSFRAKNKKYKVRAERGEDLLLSLDIFLKKHRINLIDAKEMRLDFSQEKSITSRRVAQAILQAIKIGKEWR